MNAQAQQAQKAFEAMMRGNGYKADELVFVGGEYAKASVQLRWRIFLMGWEMANLAKGAEE